jgi:putative peptide zinc metalloprotease protein
VDHYIVEPGGLVVTARSDLTATPRYERDEAFVFLEDSLRNRYFRLGLAEYSFFLALDGKRTVAEAAAEAAANSGSLAVTLDEALTLTKWLADAGLVVSDASASPARLDRAERKQELKSLADWNPWFLRIALGRPTRYLELLEPVGRVLFSRKFFVGWCLLVAYALLVAVTDWRHLAATRPIDLGWRGIAMLAGTWCLLKLIHETAHGLACRRFGGTVGNCGVAFLLGVPLPFVEVSSVWKLPDKHHRIIVSLAGVYVELFVAAAAMLVWSYSSDDVVRHAAAATAAVASLGTLLFNLNPLMRFDGYFALSDWVEIPNLASVAGQEFRRVVRRHALGIDEPSSDSSLRRPRWLPWFGAAALAWRTIVVASLLLLSLARFGFLMTALFSILPASYVAARLHRVRMSRHRLNLHGPINRRRLMRTYGILGAVAASWLFWFDPCEMRLAAVVDYEPLCIVRAATPGFVQAVHVSDGQSVVAGQVLVELTNRDLEVEVVATEQSIAQSVGKSRMFRDAGEIAKEQAETRSRAALEAKLQQLRMQQAELIVKAPRSGTVVSRGLAELQDRWLEEGDQITVVGNEAEKELLVAVSQHDAEFIRDRLDGPAVARFAGKSRSVTSRIGTLDPQAARTIMHPAMSAENGGPLPIYRREATDSPNDEQTTIAELHEPYFRLHCRLSAEHAANVQAGRSATLTIRTSVFEALLRRWMQFEHWVAEKTRT